MIGYLKNYYGYQNFGDEILIFGVLDRIKNNTETSKLNIEVGDEKWMKSWFDRHSDIINDIGLDYSIRQIGYKSQIYPDQSDKLVHIGKPLAISYKPLYLFFGGGEVLNDQDPYIIPSKANIKHYCYYILSKIFTRSGWNYLFKYHKTIFQRRFYILGGIGKPYKTTTKLLYKIILPRAISIVCRETTSHKIAQRYNKSAILHHDFAKYIVDKFGLIASTYHPQFDIDTSNPYILINIQSQERSDKTLIQIQAFIDKHPNKTIIYFPSAIGDDDRFYHQLIRYIPHMQFYDWTQYHVFDTLYLFLHCHDAIGSRLHFIYPLHIFGKTYTSIGSKDKIKKLLSPISVDEL